MQLKRVSADRSLAGAYTTCRTVGRDSIFEWSMHIERLAESARLLQTGDVTVPASLISVEELRVRVADALRAVRTLFDECEPTRNGEIKFTVLTYWGDGQPHIAALAEQLPPRPARPVIAQVRSLYLVLNEFAVRGVPAPGAR